MADTLTLNSSRVDLNNTADDIYSRAVGMSLDGAEPSTAAPKKTEAAGTTGGKSSAGTTPGEMPTHDVVRSEAVSQRAEIAQIAETSLLRIEQLRAENIELRAEAARIRQELVRVRERNVALEKINFNLDDKLGELHASEKKIADLQRNVEYLRGARKHTHQELHTIQQALMDAEKRFTHTEAQLRSICQERADRITVLTEELQVSQKSKAELEQQLETLLSYRQRAMACMHQLTEEVKRLRKDDREKSRRLSEARAVLQSIDRRLAESLTEQTFPPTGV